MNIPLTEIKLKNGGILRVDMTSGERIEFSKEQPGRIYKESIIGTDVRVTGELDKAYMKGIEKDKKGKILRVWVSIPLSEVKLVRIKELNTSLTILAVIPIIAISAFLVIMAICVGDN